MRTLTPVSLKPIQPELAVHNAEALGMIGPETGKGSTPGPVPVGLGSIQGQRQNPDLSIQIQDGLGAGEKHHILRLSRDRDLPRDG
jgi:hypothetical protein